MNGHDPSSSRQKADAAFGEDFRSAMRHLASGVSVIPTGQGEGHTGLRRGNPGLS